MRPIRIYIDTCVFGGAFDKEFSTVTQTFFHQAQEGSFSLVISTLVQDELIASPQEVRDLLTAMLPLGETVYPTSEALLLQQAYLSEDIVTPKWADDALHVAIASVTRCDMIISWNFKHIVHYQKILRYNAVNILRGYPVIAINTPAEVVEYEE